MKISYELALQLKEAGFPLTQSKSYKVKYFDHDGKSVGASFGDSKISKEIDIVIPTLSEFIDASGDETVTVKYFTSRVEGKRIANAECKGICQVGSTPEEAMAKLFIALNKK